MDDLLWESPSALFLIGRSHILKLGGLDVFLDIIRRQESGKLAESSQREYAKVAKEAAAGLLGLLEDNQTKLEVGFYPKSPPPPPPSRGPLLDMP